MPRTKEAEVRQDGPARIAVKLTPEVADAVQRGATTIGEILEQAVPGTAQGTRQMPLFRGIASDAIATLAERATRVDPNYRPPNLRAWWELELDVARAVDVDEVDAIVAQVEELSEVEAAYVLRPLPPPAAPAAAAAPHVALTQEYLNAAPRGINAVYARSVPGGRGDGIGFVDVEQGWNLAHEDLAAAHVTPLPGQNTTEKGARPHGTSVLGIVLMVDGNGVGGVGIAPNSVGRVVSQFQPDPDHLGQFKYNTAAAIAVAAAAMAMGDVLLLEVQEYDPVTKTAGPAEVVQANYEVMELATRGQVVIVEAAGNGAIDFNSYATKAGLRIFDRTVRDSWAIMVAEASSTQPYTASCMTVGARVDCFAWGDSIQTATTDEPGTDNTAYDLKFGRTSGASAIVAGAALVVQGVSEQPPGSRLSPLALRAALAVGGTKPAASDADKIGVMPNLRAIIDGILPHT